MRNAMTVFETQFLQENYEINLAFVSDQFVKKKDIFLRNAHTQLTNIVFLAFDCIKGQRALFIYLFELSHTHVCVCA